MLKKCPVCGSNKFIAGKLSHQSSRDICPKVTFKPSGLRFRLTLFKKDKAVVERESAVCYNCGFLHSKVNLTNIKEVIQSFGKKEQLKYLGEAADNNPNNASNLT